MIPQAEQAPKEKKSKEMFLEAIFVIEEDSNDNNNNSCSSLRAGNTGLMSSGG